MPPVADDIERLEVCSQCDSVVGLSALQKGETACCGRCGHELERFNGWTPRQLLAVCLTAWIRRTHVLA